MAGAFDRESFPLASIKASPTNSIEKAFNSAMANMDKVLANPKATTKQITTAMDKLNVATDKYAQSVLKTIGSSGTTEIPNPINPPSQGFDFGGLLQEEQCQRGVAHAERGPRHYSGHGDFSTVAAAPADC
jgi:hypothetical protein